MAGEVNLREVEMSMFLVNLSPLSGELAVVEARNFFVVAAACLLQLQVFCLDALGFGCFD